MDIDFKDGFEKTARSTSTHVKATAGSSLLGGAVGASIPLISTAIGSVISRKNLFKSGIGRKMIRSAKGGAINGSVMGLGHSVFGHRKKI